MATLETRDFLGMLDYPALPHSSPSPSSASSVFSSLLQFSLRVPESHCNNDTDSYNTVCVEKEGNSTEPAMIDPSSRKRKRSAEQELIMQGDNVYGYPLYVLMAPPLRNSVTPLRIPLARKASLLRFFQKRNQSLQNLRLNGMNSSSDRSATFLQFKSEAIPSHTEIELIYSPYLKRQCLQNLETQ